MNTRSHTDNRPFDPWIRIRRSELLRDDNYGVEGSTFWVCRLCDRESGAGVLRKPIIHTNDCPLGRYEARMAKKRSKTDEERT